MVYHLFLEILCSGIAFTTLIFSYPLYVKNRDVHALFWFVCWGLWIGLISLLHVSIGLFCSYPDTFIPATGSFERLVSCILIMLCVYPGQSKEERFIFLKKKYWIYALISLTIYLTFVLCLLPSDTFKSIFPDTIRNYLEITQMVVVAVIFGRLVDIVTKWANILRWSIACSLIASVVLYLSGDVYSLVFYIGHIFKVLSYATMLFAISYVWYRISIYNGNTLKQIVGAYYGSRHKSPVNI